MKKEITISAKTIEEAVEIGAAQLNIKKESVTFEVIEMPKKGFLGFGSSEAKVKISGKMSATETASEYLKKIISHMELTADVIVKSESEREVAIDVKGENLGILIGYHGEILDSLQYLTFLAVNKGEEDEDDISLAGKKEGSVKIHIDIENYREKRKQTLETLAKRMAERVIKYKRPVTLEPMNSYERRIIHSIIQEMEGVTTYSVGQDDDRKIVITKEGYRRTEGYSNSGTPSYRSYSERTENFPDKGTETQRREDNPRRERTYGENRYSAEGKDFSKTKKPYTAPKKTYNNNYGTPKPQVQRVKAKSFEEYNKAQEEAAANKTTTTKTEE